MKRCILFALVALSNLLLTGCGDGMAHSRRERMERYDRIYDIETRQLTDDWDYFWLQEQPSRLSRWRVE